MTGLMDSVYTMRNTQRTTMASMDWKVCNGDQLWEPIRKFALPIFLLTAHIAGEPFLYKYF